MDRSVDRIRGGQPGWSGRPLRRRPLRISTKRRSCPGKLTTTTRLNRSTISWRAPVSDSHTTAVDTTTPPPQLRHHFADMEQQKNTASLGMWLFLVTEIMFFGGLFCAYLIYRLMHFNAFAAASQQLSIGLGAFNTAVLLVSSVTVVLAVYAAQEGKRTQLVIYLVLTVVLGLTFLGVKTIGFNKKI